MAKPRGLYTPVYASLPRHGKVRAAATALRCDRVKLVGHLVCLWTWCLGSAAQDGAVLTAEDVALGAEWPERRATQLSDALADAGFLERVAGGYTVHEWAEYGGKVAGIQQADRERHARRTSTEIPQNFHGDSSLDETRREETKEEETRDLQNPPTPRSKRGSRAHEPVDEPFIASLVVKHSDVWSESEVRERIATALNHTASRKWIDKRKGVTDWLRRDAANAPRRPTPLRPASGGYLAPVAPNAYEHLIHRGYE